MPRQGIMLCYPFELTRFKKWGSKALLQPKYNGDRCRAIFNSEGKVTLLSSEGRQLTSVPHLINKLQQTHLKNLELDGELYTHMMDHELIHGIASRKNNLHPSHEELGFTVFDLVLPKPLEERIKELIHLAPLFPEGIIAAPTAQVSSLQEVEKRLEEIYNDGYEGIVLKQLGGAYERKRSTQWMKYKPRLADVYLIRGTKEEVDLKGKAKNALGAFICQSGEEEVFRVGSGPLLTREARERLWELRESLPGMYLQIKYQQITAANKVPLFPVAFAVISEEEARKWEKGEEDE